MSTIKKRNKAIGEMAQQFKSLVTKPNDQSLIPGTHILEGEKLPSDLFFMCQGIHACVHACT